ncbi:MAG: hypothetical protein JOY72_09905, partial [Actinobacteria bacterium]|nr:hypothetical protein [Actinomycetota bacterium]
MRDRRRGDPDLTALLLARRSRLRRVQKHRRTAAVLTAVGVAVVALLVATAAGGRAVVMDSCDLDSLAPLSLGQNSFVYASDGTLLGVVPSLENRQPL